ncbi:hypothetical protein FGO68_gene14213 [Halteria grandinella]|uniref:Uncharacterized protein n=1 Tax=Halteria grandinella TaxID=5974 RepID=A0A8J8NU07_HALGN|nr:hypothetical protein FGO68_gene14213 [Halteria grandinella]
MTTLATIPSTIKHSRVLLVRHAKSLFNDQWPVLDTLHTMALPNFQRYRKEHYEFSKNPSFIDCGLCDEGKLQCEEQAHSLRTVRDITTVFVSPMRRTLETASRLFKGHPDLKTIDFLVHPGLRENMCCSCDIPHRNFREVAEEYRECFPRFDDDTYMRDRLQATNHWYLDDLQAPLRVPALQGLARGDGEFCVQQYLLEEIGRCFPARVESPYNTYLRSERFKAFLKDFIASKAFKGGKVVLVGHKTIFKFMTGTEWETLPLGLSEDSARQQVGKMKIRNNYSKDPINFKNMNNCEFYPLDSHLF